MNELNFDTDSLRCSKLVLFNYYYEALPKIMTYKLKLRIWLVSDVGCKIDGMIKILIIVDVNDCTIFISPVYLV